MRNIIYTLALVIISIKLSAQLIKNENQKKKINIGLHTGFVHFDGVVDSITNEKGTFNNYYFAPFVSYNVFNNFNIGIRYYQDFTKSNIYSKGNFKELGVFLKYYMPYYIDKSFVRRMKFFIEISYNKTNYIRTNEKTLYSYKLFYLEEDHIIYGKLNQTLINIPIGVDFMIWKGLSVELSINYYNYIKGKKYINPMFRFGINYKFKNKDSENI